MREGVVQAGEAGDHAVNAGEREDAQDRSIGNDQPQLAAVGLGALMRRQQRMERLLPCFSSLSQALAWHPPVRPGAARSASGLPRHSREPLSKATGCGWSSPPTAPRTGSSRHPPGPDHRPVRQPGRGLTPRPPPGRVTLAHNSAGVAAFKGRLTSCPCPTGTFLVLRRIREAQPRLSREPRRPVPARGLVAPPEVSGCPAG